MMKNIFTKREFLDRVKIIKLIKSDHEKFDKILLLNETDDQRTYLVKDDYEFYIINDNKGSLKIALRKSLERLKYEIFETQYCYLISIEKISPEVKASKIIFESKNDLKFKIDEL